MKNILLMTICWSVLLSQHLPSGERGDPEARRQTNIQANNIRTSIFNFGLTGRTGAVPDQIPYEWPINSGQYYIALTGLLVGSEVVTAEGDTMPLVTVPLGRTDNNGNSMMFEPIPQYLNDNSDLIAINNDYTTWPDCWNNKFEDSGDPGWCNSWNSYFGKNFFIEGEEIYYRMSDDNNFLLNRTYYPDLTDTTRRGAGIIVDSRTIAWDLAGLEDVIFHIYTIINDGTEYLSTNAVTLWLADLVGGDGDAGDDIIAYNLDEQIVWSSDADGIGGMNYGSDPVGIPALLVLRTPDDNGITSIAYSPAGSVPTGQDLNLWYFYMTPGDYWVAPPGGQPPGDYDLLISSGYFSLAPGEEKEFICATILSVDTVEMYQKANLVRLFYNYGFQPNPPQLCRFNITGHPDYVYSGTNTSAQIHFDIKNYFGNGIEGIPINVVTSAGLIDDILLSDSAGQAVAEFTINDIPSDSVAIISASINEPETGFENAQLTINIIPEQLQGDSLVPIPFNLNVELHDLVVLLLWDAEYFGEGTLNLPYYHYNIYRNNEYYDWQEGIQPVSGFWSRDSLWNFALSQYKAYTTIGERIAAQYRIEIIDAGCGQSNYFEQSYGFWTREYPSVPTNFLVKKKTQDTGDDNIDWEENPYAFGDFSPYGGNGLLDGDSVETDLIILLDDTSTTDSIGPSWIIRFEYPRPFESEHIYQPGNGDILNIDTRYRFIDTLPVSGENCYQVTRFYPVNSETQLFPPGTESLPSDEVCVTVSNVRIYSDKTVDVPTTLLLFSNYPNPFNPTTTIQYDLPNRSDVQITIFDLLGREVTTLVSETQAAGYKSVIWAATNDLGQPVSAGIYFYRIKVGNFVQTKKMVFIK
ncbi:MAG: T9SS type A sorting domain-containing protein [Candidatus Marinimicrobia bacterium]|nr:T9SS type A sorting domain-containing protein [Candidatus Neomarinimicrobiota bacterium]